jgi:hypothetical protein
VICSQVPLLLSRAISLFKIIPVANKTIPIMEAPRETRLMLVGIYLVAEYKSTALNANIAATANSISPGNT